MTFVEASCVRNHLCAQRWPDLKATAVWVFSFGITHCLWLQSKVSSSTRIVTSILQKPVIHKPSDACHFGVEYLQSASKVALRRMSWRRLHLLGFANFRFHQLSCGETDEVELWKECSVFLNVSQYAFMPSQDHESVDLFCFRFTRRLRQEFPLCAVS